MWIRHKELLWGIAVEALLPQEEIVSKTVIKHAGANAEHGLRGLFGISADAPSETEPRGKIGVIAKIILGFEPKTVTQGDVRAKPPVVLKVRPGIEISDVGQCAAGSDRREACTAYSRDGVLQICVCISRGQDLK